ncbi:MAG: hypothetical protein ACRCX2_36410 [Paraclostridium sp.]
MKRRRGRVEKDLMEEKFGDNINYKSTSAIVRITMFVLKRVLFDFIVLIIVAIFKGIAFLIRKVLGKDANKVSKTGIKDYFKNILSEYKEK